MRVDEQFSKSLSLNEVRDLGILREINRQLLHPMGIAMFVDMDATGSVFAGFYDYRDDPEGMVYTESSPEKAETFQSLFEEKREVREKTFGWHVQPSNMGVSE